MTATRDWTKVSIDLPKGAKYFAIHHVTPKDINQMLMVDDISYTRGIGEVLGYRIYRDGKYLATVASPAYTDNDGGNHEYNVTVVYNSGESGLSNTASTKASTGIRAITDATASGFGTAPVYNLSGQRVGSSYRGVVISNGRKVLRR